MGKHGEDIDAVRTELRGAEEAGGPPSGEGEGVFIPEGKELAEANGASAKYRSSTLS
jgi:hypothetical protein